MIFTKRIPLPSYCSGVVGRTAGKGKQQSPVKDDPNRLVCSSLLTALGPLVSDS
jgi:hypothetical protein